MKRLIIALALLVTAACDTKPTVLPSIFAVIRAGDATAATCYADGMSWPARVDGTTVNCFAADMPKEGK